MRSCPNVRLYLTLAPRGRSASCHRREVRRIARTPRRARQRAGRLLRRRRLHSARVRGPRGARRAMLAVLATSDTYPESEAQARGSWPTSSASGSSRSRPASSPTPLHRQRTDRCYHCKSELFAPARGSPMRHGLSRVADGSNADDLHDHRPGRRAATELTSSARLPTSGLTKADIRQRRARTRPSQLGQALDGVPRHHGSRTANASPTRASRASLPPRRPCASSGIAQFRVRSPRHGRTHRGRTR